MIEETYEQVPPRPFLTSRWAETVRCHQCGKPLRPGARGPVTKDAKGWHHGKAGEDCKVYARGLEGSDVLIAMLAVSVDRGPT